MDSSTVILPPATIGILGGGQLGAMLCEAGKRMGYKMLIMSTESTDPAGHWADQHVVANTDDPAAVVEFASRVNVLTNEFEQVSPAVLEAVERALPHVRVAPSSHVQSTCRDRGREKNLFQDNGFPVGPFALVDQPDEMPAAYEKLSEVGKLPVVAKVAHGGYDGKGQAWMRSRADVAEVWQKLSPGVAPDRALFPVRLMLEQGVPFVAEASVIVVRSPKGEVTSFPMFRNTHRNGILHQTSMPGGFGAETEKAARAAAQGIATVVGAVGLLTVEMFVLEDGRVLINELAARPHNSGHVTLRATTRSQFELHLAAICNLPLAPVEVLRPGVMTNLLGDLWKGEEGTMREPAWPMLFRESHGTLHLYGKSPRAGRKMGHMIHTGETIEAAKRTADQVFASLGGKA